MSATAVATTTTDMSGASSTEGEKNTPKQEEKKKHKGGRKRIREPFTRVTINCEGCGKHIYKCYGEVMCAFCMLKYSFPGRTFHFLSYPRKTRLTN